jgi:hypothetical protein
MLMPGSAWICGSETFLTAIQTGACAPSPWATMPSTASPISDTSPTPCSLKWLSEVSKPKKSVVTTEEVSPSGGTTMMSGGRVLSFGSCPSLAANSVFALAKNCGLAGLLL